MRIGLKILDKYIFDTLVSFFIFGVIIFSSVLMVSDAFLDLIRYVVNYGVPLKTSLIIIILRIPSLVVLTIPIGVLLSVLLTLNKLSGSSEITAIRTSGISLIRMATPVITFGFLSAMFSFALSEYVVPITNQKANEVKRIAFMQAKLPLGKQNFTHKEISSAGDLRRLFYINQYTQGRIEGIVMLDFTRENMLQVLTGKAAQAQPNQWVFEDGNVYTISNTNSTTNVSTFAKLVLANDYSDMQLSKKANYDELSIRDSLEKIQKNHFKTVLEKRKFLVKLFEKISIPFACFCIAIVAFPISIYQQRTKINWGFPLSVCILFVYYIIRSFTVPFGINGTIDTFTAVWFPNFLLLGLGIVMLYAKNK